MAAPRGGDPAPNHFCENGHAFFAPSRPTPVCPTCGGETFGHPDWAARAAARRSPALQASIQASIDAVKNAPEPPPRVPASELQRHVNAADAAVAALSAELLLLPEDDDQMDMVVEAIDRLRDALTPLRYLLKVRR